MNYLLDTNIVLIYLRDEHTRGIIERDYDPFSPTNNPVISVVTVGEIKSIALRNQWGKRKKELLDDILHDLIIADIRSEDVIDMYAEIDAFSQGKIPGKPLNMTARNMGKNDLWIAATACVTQSRLLTTDKDFDHLADTYIEVIRIPRFVR
jgi:tRNA(fMet)-specific endonuclease VapC